MGKSMTGDEVLRTAQELLERSEVLQRELELFYLQQAEQGLEPLSSVDHAPENAVTGDDGS
ncbi:hypothetical protein [Deinococcus sp. QL22]|uniref:hypothetical protein n=1 Tax=Deinococcus sp. QL22 TaxID=2939437 RepID=UPI0020178B92|nr:hypothetical protein [Deinococcus sp. QL22]UQN08626.1 hypothetical protein M1R55_21090 [Deinococcus sp. QL22]